MLQFKQDNTAAKTILTLTEMVTINEPQFIFVFTHVLTKSVVTIVKLESDDESDYPERYNQFTIDAVAEFDEKPTGEWHYKVFESIDGTAQGNLLEQGKLLLGPAQEFEYPQFNTPTSYKAYNG